MASTTASSTTESITNTISDAVNFKSETPYVSETIQGKSAESKKEANKEIAKGNTGASVGDRISAGVDAIGNKADESKHDASAEAHKQSFKN
ncbi:hypothetical protein JCM10908_006685 [Rhodotorula pacifica]|uniref:uncharacterized protein n=1 Tax=Rhodotorula pacifica TaxID=1495444 RepID=UPI0031742C4A